MKLFLILSAWGAGWFAVCAVLAHRARLSHALPTVIINGIARVYWMAGMAAGLTLAFLLRVAGI